MYQARIVDVDALHALIPTPSGKVITVDKETFYSDYKFLIGDLNFYLLPGDVVCFDVVSETSDEPRATSLRFPKPRLADSEGWGIVETQTDSEARVWSPEFGTVLLRKETISNHVMGFSGTYFQELTKPGSRILFEVSRRSIDSSPVVAKSFRSLDCSDSGKMVGVFGPFEVKLPNCLTLAPTSAFVAEASKFGQLRSRLTDDLQPASYPMPPGHRHDMKVADHENGLSSCSCSSRDSSIIADQNNAALRQFSAPVMPTLADECDITSDNLCSKYRGTVEKHGVVTSLRRDGAYVWCQGFPHLFARNCELVRDTGSCSCYQLAPFDVVRVRLTFDAGAPAPRRVRISRIQRSTEPDISLAEQVTVPLMLATATVEHIDPLGKHCMLARIDDGGSDQIFMNRSAFPLFVEKVSDYLTQGSSVCVAFVEQFGFERFGLSRFFAVAMLPCDTPSIARVWNKTSNARRRLFENYRNCLLALSSYTKSSHSTLPEIGSAVSTNAAAAPLFSPISASEQFSARGLPPEPIPSASFHSLSAPSMRPVANALANFAVGLQRIVRVIPPSAPAVPQAAVDIVSAPQAPQLANYAGLICVVHPSKIVIFNEILGKVDVDLNGTEGPTFQAYQTLEMEVDIQSLAATGRVTIVSLRVVQTPFTGFDKLRFLDAVVCEIISEQTAVLRSVANGDRILCVRSALPDAMAQHGDFFAGGARLRALVCGNPVAAARPLLNCNWQALRLLPGPHCVEIGQIRLINGSLCR